MNLVRLPVLASDCKLVAVQYRVLDYIRHIFCLMYKSFNLHNSYVQESFSNNTSVLSIYHYNNHNNIIYLQYSTFVTKTRTLRF